MPEAGLKTQKIYIGGMTCIHCQNKIEKKLRHTAGIQNADVSYQAGTAVVTYDTDLIALREIAAIIQRLGYEVLTGQVQAKGSKSRSIGILLLIFSVYLLFKQFSLADMFNAFPLAEAGMGYGMLLIIGLFTSVHCIAMCSGINLSQ